MLEVCKWRSVVKSRMWYYVLLIQPQTIHQNWWHWHFPPGLPLTKTDKGVLNELHSAAGISRWQIEQVCREAESMGRGAPGLTTGSQKRLSSMEADNDWERKSPGDFRHCGGYSHSVFKAGLCETGRPRNDHVLLAYMSWRVECWQEMREREQCDFLEHLSARHLGVSWDWHEDLTGD